MPAARRLAQSVRDLRRVARARFVRCWGNRHRQELVSRHHEERGDEQPFVTSSAGLDPTLFASELFGHERGASPARIPAHRRLERAHAPLFRRDASSRAN